MSIIVKNKIFVNSLRHVRSISYYITTPIFYVNSSPHIGHVHTLLLADAVNIYQRLKLADNRTIFSTGTDEHGIKIQAAAEANNVSCIDLCNENSRKFQDLFDQYDTTLTDFIRTSDNRHKEAVKFVWNNLKSKGFIYKSTYSGWYCESDETFVPESSVSKKEINGEMVHVEQDEKKVVWSHEENYMFRLSDVKDTVLDWLITEKPVIPEKFNNEAISMLKKSTIGDISISRPVNRLNWGIEVPDDASQTIYVWLDALTNYLTISGYPCELSKLKRWPIDCQVIGKDIIKFHAIYWAGFLSALSLPLPKKFICHSHWLIDSFKMSKSRGNVVVPSEENQALTHEGLRYYLLRASTPHSDTDYSRIQALRRVNAELADTYGNLMSRCCASAINPNQTIPTRLTDNPSSTVVEIQQRLIELPNNCAKHYEFAEFYKGIDDVMSVLRLNNALYEITKPWKLVKELSSNSKSFEDYSNVQTITFETLRICSILLQPIVPRITSRALDRLNVPNRFWSDTKVAIQVGDPLLNHRSINKEAEPVLFQRLKSHQTNMQG